jgi:cysteinyl-tRNA synthetase
MKAYNTLTRKVEELTTREKGKLFIYVCGLTPYDSMHIGHARTLAAFDVMRRWWEHKGIEVVHMQNVTDIDDKIIKRAKEQKIMPLALSAKFDAQSREEMGQLGLLPPTYMPKISEFVPQTIALIGKIIANGHAYATESGIYFDIPSFPNYGKLSGQDMGRIRAGARIEVDEKKRNPEDFALWKLEETPGATFDSPWGRGRPGWHIECSAMSLHYTGGKPLDVHGGARDLIFPHHENEIAQSEASGAVPFSKHWIHTGFLTVNGEKMSKSLGNFITVKDALSKWDANCLRLFFALTHYRSPIDFSENAIEGAKTALDNVRRSLGLMEGEGSEKGEEKEGRELAGAINSSIKKFNERMDDDFDTPNAVSELIGASKEIARAKAEGRVGRKKIAEEAEKIASAFAIIGIDAIGAASSKKITKEEVEALVGQRADARATKQWKKSDELRERLKALGVIVEDTKGGKQIWKYA